MIDVGRLTVPFGGRSGWGLLGVGAVMAIGFAVRWTLLPASIDPGDVDRADAVVVFAGASERLPAAIDLMDRGTADVLVLPNGTSPVWAAANELCGDDSLGYEVVCPTPEPITTRGEARAIGHLAIERQWTSLVAVTSTYHLARAELLLSRCFPGRIQAVAAERELTRSQRWRLVRHELAAHAAHRTVLRRC